MSVRDNTPTGRPASSITGAMLKPRSIMRPRASRTVASAEMEIGLDVMRSAAVFAARTRRLPLCIFTAVIAHLSFGILHGDVFGMLREGPPRTLPQRQRRCQKLNPPKA